MNTNQQLTTITRKRDKGFTLVEILIAIVVVGILAAVAIVGINSLTDTGADSACKASADAARAASAAYFANNNGYPTSFSDFTSTQSAGTQKEFVVPDEATINATSVEVSGKWTLNGNFSGTTPSFTCA